MLRHHVTVGVKASEMTVLNAVNQFCWMQLTQTRRSSLKTEATAVISGMTVMMVMMVVCDVILCIVKFNVSSRA